ncbi:SigB/SigF/SigG family RNA polymerase sigma factor [Actinopolymorpha sp. NPDC004070]|uniref:SigB/SigF/SigG family RNA polymerase sigma factor n=1 Tax=Actinopolymorpha sp. NPDC004070 TaxID=3154548 RepID=UPI0033BBA4C6
MATSITAASAATARKRSARTSDVSPSESIRQARMALAANPPSDSQSDQPDADGSAATTAARKDADRRNARSGSRSQLVLDHIGLARNLASRYAGRGEPLEELHQVAMVGLVLAADRFDPERGTSFSTFAVPTILGELRRHFRDHCWSVRIPRRLHDLHRAVRQANEDMANTLRRPPTVSELAKELDVREEDILQAQESAGAYSALSLESPVDSGEPDADTLGDLIGHDDTNVEYIENREAVRRVIPHVPERERRILYLTYFRERTQAQIAAEFGISQMQVSRLLATTLSNIRSAVIEDKGVPTNWPTPRQQAS